MQCEECGQEKQDERHDHPHDYCGPLDDFLLGKPCRQCQRQHYGQLVLIGEQADDCCPDCCRPPNQCRCGMIEADDYDEYEAKERMWNDEQ